MQLHTAGLLVIKNRQLLLAFSNNKQCFYLPGGKIAAGETAAKALCREIEEELHTAITEESLQFYTHITAPAYGEAAGVLMEQDCYFCTTDIQPVASAEISELAYFTLAAYQQQPVTAPGAIMILEQLKKEGYID